MKTLVGRLAGIAAGVLLAATASAQCAASLVVPLTDACHVQVKAKDHVFHPYQKR